MSGVTENYGDGWIWTCHIIYSLFYRVNSMDVNDLVIQDAKTSAGMAFNSLAPGRFKVNFRWVIFKLILVVNGWGISRETALIWMSLDHTYVKSTVVQVMAWCRQATSHYLSQCWPRSMSPYGVTRPQWVNKFSWRILLPVKEVFMWTLTLILTSPFFVITAVQCGSTRMVLQVQRNQVISFHEIHIMFEENIMKYWQTMIQAFV